MTGHTHFPELLNSQPASSARQRSKQRRLFDNLDAAAVDGAAASAPGAEERDQVQQEPDGDALVLVYPKEDDDARDEHRDDNRDDADRRRDQMRHAVLEPCDDHAEARQEERQDKEPQGDRVDREGEGEFHRADFLGASALGRYVKAFVCRKMPLKFTTRTGTSRLETSYKAIDAFQF